MKTLLQGLRAWWRRRFRGYVVPPRQHGGRGTHWQQHRREDVVFICRGTIQSGPFEGKQCGLASSFTEADYFVREQDHAEGCEGWVAAENVVSSKMKSPAKRCSCPVTDARYVKLCPQCGLGHWKDAIPK